MPMNFQISSNLSSSQQSIFTLNNIAPSLLANILNTLPDDQKMPFKELVGRLKVVLCLIIRLNRFHPMNSLHKRNILLDLSSSKLL